MSELVAGYRFGGFFFFGVGVGMAIAVGVAVAVGWSDGYGLARVGEIGGYGLGDIVHRSDLDDRGLRLLEHQLFVNGAHFGLFLVGLFAAQAVFLGGSQRDIVLEVTDARSVFRVDFERVLVGIEIHLFALSVDLVFAVGLVPLGDG